MDKKIKKYVIFTYLMFFLFIVFIGFVMMTLKNDLLVLVLQKISAWTPTFVLMLMFKKMYPQDTRLSFIIRQFSEKIPIKILFSSIGIPIAIFIGAMTFSVFYFKKPFYELMIISPLPLIYMLPFHLVSGPLGEELGWRGFLLTELLKKHNPVKSGFIVGLIWGFWHLPLWLVSGYGFPELIIYIISFLVSIICCSIIISILYSKCRNLVIPIIVHLLNNYLLGLFTFDLIQSLLIFATFYLLATFMLVLATRKTWVFDNI